MKLSAPLSKSRITNPRPHLPPSMSFPRSLPMASTSSHIGILFCCCYIRVVHFGSEYTVCIENRPHFLPTPNFPKTKSALHECSIMPTHTLEVNLKVNGSLRHYEPGTKGVHPPPPHSRDRSQLGER